MNIEPNASIFNTDGFTFPCFDDNVCTIPVIASRKSKEIIFRSDFPGSKKMTVVHPTKEKSKPISWDDIYENNRVNKSSPTILRESPSSLINDPFKPDETNRSRQPIVNKQRITLAGDLTKARSNDNSRLSKKNNNKQKSTTTNEKVIKNKQGCPPAEPIVVNWCRSASTSTEKRLTDASQISEVTSTTSATSRSGEFNEISQKGQNFTSNRCVSRSRTVGGTPSRRMNIDKCDRRKSISKEEICHNNFEVNWPSADGNPVNREVINLRTIRDTPVRSSQRNATPKRAVSTSRTERHSSVVGTTYGAEPTGAKPRHITTNRRSSLDNHQHSTPSKVKPRIYMSVSSPRKMVNLKCANQCLYGVTNSKKTLPNIDGNFCDTFDEKNVDKITATRLEPLDFSEFDAEDFSSSDDIKEGFSMPFKPVEPLYCTSSNCNKAFLQSHDNDAEEEAWSALFSPPIG